MDGPRAVAGHRFLQAQVRRVVSLTAAYLTLPYLTLRSDDAKTTGTLNGSVACAKRGIMQSAWSSHDDDNSNNNNNSQDDDDDDDTTEGT